MTSSSLNAANSGAFCASGAFRSAPSARAVGRLGRGARRLLDRGFRPICRHGGGGLAHDQVYHAVLLRFGSAHPVVAVDVVAETFNRLSSIRGHHLLQPRIHADDLARLAFELLLGP